MNPIRKVIVLFLLGFGLAPVDMTLAQEATAKKTDASKVKIQDSRTGANLKIEELIDALRRSDIIFLGEQHDNDSGHRFQLKVIEELVRSGQSVVISMEQFESDVQGALDDYLSGRLSENEFLKKSRPWSNYAKHYRPLIEFAKKKRIPVIAANIPRRIAASISRGQAVSSEDKVFLPRQTFTDKNAYWERFKATMSGHEGTEDETKLEKYFASQCLKDDMMAESISNFLAVNSHPHKIVVHLCGHFHSDYGLGTVARVLKRRPLARINVVTMESIAMIDDEQVHSSLGSRSHFTCWTNANRPQEESELDPKKTEQP